MFGPTTDGARIGRELVSIHVNYVSHKSGTSCSYNVRSKDLHVERGQSTARCKRLDKRLLAIRDVDLCTSLRSTPCVKQRKRTVGG